MLGAAWRACACGRARAAVSVPVPVPAPVAVAVAKALPEHGARCSGATRHTHAYARPFMSSAAVEASYRYHPKDIKRDELKGKFLPLTYEKERDLKTMFALKVHQVRRA